MKKPFKSKKWGCCSLVRDESYTLELSRFPMLTWYCGHGPECIPWYLMDSCWMSIDDDYDEDNSAKRYAKYYICTSKIYSCDSNISFEYGDPSYMYPCHPPFHMGRGGCGRWLPMVKWYTYHLDVLSVVLPIYILYLLPIIQLSPQIYISYTVRCNPSFLRKTWEVWMEHNQFDIRKYKIQTVDLNKSENNSKQTTKIMLAIFFLNIEYYF